MIWLIMILGIALRVYALNAFPLEQDELYTITESTDLFNSPYLPGIRARPLYYLIEHPLVNMFPHTPVALRILPFIFGVLGIWITWKLAERIAGRTAGLAAALLIALSPWHLYVSGMARYWAMVYLLAATGYLLILRASESERTRDYLLALPILIAGVLTHPTAMFPLPGIALALAWNKGWKRWNGWGLKGLWLPFTLFLSVYYTYLKTTGGTSALRNWNGRGTAASLRLIPAMVDWITPVVFTVAIVGSILLLRSTETPRRRFGTMTILGCLCGMSALLLSSQWTDVYADYGMAMLPLLIVSAGAAVQIIVEGAQERARIITLRTVTLLVVAGALPSTVSYLVDGSRFDYRWAYQWIATHKPDSPVLTWPLVVQQRYAPNLDAHPLLVQPERLDSLLNTYDGRDAWAVVSVSRYGIVGDDQGTLAPWLASRCRLVAAQEGRRFDYRMYRVELQYCSQVLQ